MAAPVKTLDLRDNPDYIRVYDQFGRELFIEKERWRKDVLPGNLKSAWNHPDQLYSVIVNALNDGFLADILHAAEHLYRTDPLPARGACVYGIALMKSNRLQEAEDIFQNYLRQHGEDGSVLTNLAKVYSAQKLEQKAEDILWHALEVDPNQDNGLGWYAVLHRERNGEQGWLDALRRVAALPTSWRAQIWLAREALKRRELKDALELYRESLSRAGADVPAELLMQMSGDLGQYGHLPEAVQLTEPHFKAQTHGLRVGNNLIKAHLDLGEINLADRILNDLYALKRPDWRETLSFWDTEIAKARVKATPVDQGKQLAAALLCIEGPIWLKHDSPAAELFAPTAPASLSICFLGSTAELQTSGEVECQITDAPGRLSRALPLFLAEQAAFSTGAGVQTLVPWIVEKPGGFVLSGKPWSDDEAAQYARQAQTRSDYVVVSHLKAQVEPWSAELRVLRTEDGKLIGSLAASFPSARPEEVVPALAGGLISLLVREAQIATQSPPVLYRIPPNAHFGSYLVRLEQLLAIRTAAMDETGPDFLNGERAIIEGNLELCVTFPESAVTRILLVQTVLAMKKVRPEVIAEFKEKLQLLERTKPLPQPATLILQKMFEEVIRD
ncbi:MAG TPA: hypothetical protein VFK06_20040 [Candidatus Angelobacter sp.]|nr:hypothetical protein [Candidatus Angelobacter sp.]